MKTILHNGTVLTGSRQIKNGGIVIENDMIAEVLESCTIPDYEDYQKIDCKGNYISPGFIDTHVHGGNGSDVMDATGESIQSVVGFHAEHGTTSLLLTTFSSSAEKIISALECIDREHKSGPVSDYILGVHLESNFFSLEHKGAQNPAYIKSPRHEEYEEYLSRAKIRMISAAPEIENGMVFGREMAQKKIVMSMAHSNATFKQAMLAVENGYTHITHIYNGISYLNSPSYYAQAGVSEAGLYSDEIIIEAIADGKHLPPELLKLIYKIKGADRFHVVTDAIRAAGMPDGFYEVGNVPIMVEDEVAMLTDRTSFAGSVATTDRLLRVLVKEAEIPLNDAVKMLTLTPAKILGEQNRIGRLAVGYQADVNVFNDEFKILMTLKKGVVKSNKL